MPALPLEMVAPMLATGASTRMPNTEPARFKPGDTVLARNMHPLHHTRLPRYVRGKRGTVNLDHGMFSFNDTVAHGLGHRPQHVYSVRFAAQELWGPDASPRDSVYIDLFDTYLDPA
jgi:nitrile hydratase